MSKDQSAAKPAAPTHAPAEKTPDAPAQVKVRVLVQCDHGAPNDVAIIDEAALKSLEGIVDADPAAVAYAESLK